MPVGAARLADTQTGGVPGDTLVGFFFAFVFGLIFVYFFADYETIQKGYMANAIDVMAQRIDVHRKWIISI